jgi:eukaryotic-like serine/threonine-protein kinase
MIAFACAHCQKTLRASDEMVGKRLRCSGCSAVLVVPVSLPSREPTTLPPPGSAEQTAPPSPLHGYDSSLIEFLAPAQTDDELGRLGGYRILEMLGHGGMGVVFLGEDARLGRKIAIKAMLPRLAQSGTAQQRFMREARAVAALEHDHIIPIFHVGQDRGAPFIVMPLLTGEPLDRRLEREGTLPVADIVRIGRQTASGLACAHAAGLVHRDIKPGNLWLESVVSSPWSVVKGKNLQGTLPLTTDHGPRTTDYRVKILDFGLARAVDDDAHLTQSGAFVGTPAYMAPEQASGQAVDGRVDLFSLGCVLSRLCTGRVPFKGKDTLSTLLAIANDVPTPVREVNPAIPELLAALVMALLAKDPDKRPASAQRVADMLAALERGAIASADVKQAHSPPPRAPEHQANAAAARAPWLVLAGIGAVAAGGGLLLVAAVALTLVLTRGGDDSEKKTTLPGPALVVHKPNEDRDRRSDAKQDLHAGAKDKEKENIAAVAHDDRVVAEWVLKSPSGHVTYRADERMPEVIATKPEQLPTGPMQVIGLQIVGAIADDDLKRIAGLPALRGLHFGLGITNAGLSYLTNLPALENLSLGSPLVTDDGLAHLQKLPALQILHLVGTKGISGAGFTHLQKLPKFKHLSLGMLEPAEGAMRHIKAIPTLERLALWSIPVTDAALVDLEGSEINRLSLTETTNTTPKGLASLRQLPRLRSLEIVKVPMPDDAVQPIGELTNLTHLFLESMKLGDSALGRLERLSQLESLSMAGNRISDRGLVHLHGMTHLENLWLYDTQVTDEGLIHLQGLKKLKALHVAGTQVTARGVQELRKSLPGLIVTGALPVGDDRAVARWAVEKGMSVNYCLARDAKVMRWTSKAADLPAEPFYITDVSCIGPFTDDDLKRLAPLPRLQSLLIGVQFATDNQGVTDAGLAYLKQARALKSLAVLTARVTDDGLAHLQHVPTLELLALHRTNIGGAGLKYLQQLPKLKSLVLDLNLADDALIHIRGMPALKRLSVAHLTDASLAHLRGTPLTHLGLPGNALTDKGYVTLLQLPKLTSLQCGLCPLSESAMKTIGRLTNLTTLDLSNVQFADEHLVHLKDLTRLRTLRLDATSTSDLGLAHLELMTEVEDLTLSKTRVTDKGLVHLQKMQNLRVLTIFDTQVTPEGIRTLKKHLKRLL